MSHRVIQWGTGNVGIHSLRHLIQHPDYELVGVHAHSPSKVGKDAADIAGLKTPTGVIATNDADALLALKPDCVVYNANGENRPDEAVADFVKILSAGVNVVSTAMIFIIYPPAAPAEMRDPIEAACKKGNSSLYISGIDPGFSGDVLPLAGLQMADQVEQIIAQELVNYSTYEDPDFTGVAFGFGEPASYNPILAEPGILTMSWGGMVYMLADRLGVKIDEISESYERVYAPEAFDTPMMHVPKDTCCAVRFRLEGMVEGRPLIVTEHVDYFREQDIPDDWPHPPVGQQGVHRAVIKGDPNITMDVHVEGKDGDYNTGGVQTTALRMINAIPAVCEHKAGMLSTLDLPLTPSTHFVK